MTMNRLPLLTLLCLIISGASAWDDCTADKGSYSGDETIIVSYSFTSEPAPLQGMFWSIHGDETPNYERWHYDTACFAGGTGNWCLKDGGYPASGTIEFAASSLPFVGEYYVVVGSKEGGYEISTNTFMVDPTVHPSSTPSLAPSVSQHPSGAPSGTPSLSSAPSTSAVPSSAPIASPSSIPSSTPSSAPSLPDPTIAVSTSKASFFTTEMIEIQFDLFPARENVFVRLEGENGDFIWECAPGAAVGNPFCNKPNGELHRRGTISIPAKHLSVGQYMVHLGQIFGIQHQVYLTNTTITLHPPTEAPSSEPSSLPSSLPSSAPSALETLAPGLSSGQVYTYTLVHTLTDLCYDAAAGTGGETTFTGFPCPGDPSKIRWEYMSTRDHTKGANTHCLWDRQRHAADWLAVYMGTDVCGVGPTKYSLPMDPFSLPVGCPRPSSTWCNGPGEVYKSDVDCDGDGLLDQVCYNDSGSRGVLLSGSNCQETWPTAGVDKCPAVFGSCERPNLWCTHSGTTYKYTDCNGDGIPQHVCYDNAGHRGVIQSSTCGSSWPNAVKADCASVFP